MASSDADTNVVTSNKTQPNIRFKYVGLDPLNSTYLKLFIKDISSLNQIAFQETDSLGHCFHDHVVEKVEIMGIVVRVDLKESKHSYSVDDGTGVILCNLWRKQRHQITDVINGLPKSLLIKHQEIKSSCFHQNEGFHLGDLVCCRGRVVVFAGQKEIDVLDIAKFDDPNHELERVLELPVLYSKCYTKSFNLPKCFIINSTDLNYTLSPEVLKHAILKRIRESKEAVQMFSEEDIQFWFSSNSQTSSTGLVSNPSLLLIRAALALIYETDGLIYKRTDLNNSYEVIKDGCGLNAEVLRLMQMLCEGKNSDGTGCYVNQIYNLLKTSPCYCETTLIAVQKSVESLENSSHVINVDSNKYLPLF